MTNYNFEVFILDKIKLLEERQNKFDKEISQLGRNLLKSKEND
jgi:hypothetical protein